MLTFHHGRPRSVQGAARSKIPVARSPSMSDRLFRPTFCLRVLTNPRRETVMTDLENIMGDYGRPRQAGAKLNEDNKVALFDVLAAASITEGHVDFDGEGDIGQINRDRKSVV